MSLQTCPEGLLTIGPRLPAPAVARRLRARPGGPGPPSPPRIVAAPRRRPQGPTGPTPPGTASPSSGPEFASLGRDVPPPLGPVRPDAGPAGGRLFDAASARRDDGDEDPAAGRAAAARVPAL